MIERMLGQLADIGVPRAYVITRPEWEEPLQRAVERAGVPERPSGPPRARAGTSREIARDRARAAAAAW